MKLSTSFLYSRKQIAQRISELANEIDCDLRGKEVVVLVALKGAIPMAIDLIRAMKTSVTLELIRAKSYEGSESTGNVTFTHLPECTLRDKTVLIIEDIIDTGQTCSAIREILQNDFQANDIRIVTLLDKPSRRKVVCEVNWVGFSIDDVFVVGYGMDFDEAYRDLSDIHTMEP